MRISSAVSIVLTLPKNEHRRGTPAKKDVGIEPCALHAEAGIQKLALNSMAFQTKSSDNPLSWVSTRHEFRLLAPFDTTPQRCSQPSHLLPELWILRQTQQLHALEPAIAG